jgi:hypothetical protein
MPDLNDPRLMYLKAWLFLAIGLLGITGILLIAPSLRLAALLAITIWAFCRLYYFLFYVIERYIDPQYRFAGLGAAAAYLWQKRGGLRARKPQP